MKNFSYLATIAATAMVVAVPVTAGAQGIFQRSVPNANPDATTIDPTIMAPPTTTMPSMPNGYTTNFNTTTTIVSPSAYPGNRSFGKFSNYGSFSRYKRSGKIGNPFVQKPFKQQKVILSPDPMYPGFIRPNAATSPYGNYGNSKNHNNSGYYGGYGNYGGYGRSKSSSSCSTSVIGSPIPSAVPLDRSGRPCN